MRCELGLTMAFMLTVERLDARDGNWPISIESKYNADVVVSADIRADAQMQEFAA